MNYGVPGTTRQYLTDWPVEKASPKDVQLAAAYVERVGLELNQAVIAQTIILSDIVNGSSFAELDATYDFKAGFPA